jgi:hypothetical protein
MSFLFLFLDGVGLGADNLDTNPFSRAELPHLHGLLDGRRLLAESAPFEGERASLIPLDACLGVGGLPQSATGQATLLTGVNVPASIGYHYGPKPNPEVAVFLRNGNLFSRLEKTNRKAAFLNAISRPEAIARTPDVFGHPAGGIYRRPAAHRRRSHRRKGDWPTSPQGWCDHLGLSGRLSWSLPSRRRRLSWPSPTTSPSSSTGSATTPATSRTWLRQCICWKSSAVLGGLLNVGMTGAGWF